MKANQITAIGVSIVAIRVIIGCTVAVKKRNCKKKGLRNIQYFLQLHD